MRNDIAPTAIQLKDYRPSDYLIETADLSFQLETARTRVTTSLQVKRRDGADDKAPLVLNGESLELKEVRIDGTPTDAFCVDEKTLTLTGPLPASFVLETDVFINPEANTALSGLYMSKGMFCTQCEAEGFRHITYYLDRPDILTVFTVRIEADKTTYPIILANGNKIDAGDLGNGRHFAVWHDPHPKPAYLFALVGGDLACVEDQFTTMSGRDVSLQVFVQHANKDKCGYALDSLKRAMKWDEETFGREYDLDIFMIVAVDHFNFGAMENKGLNIFNSAFVLASPETATDQDYENIEAIVAHEYFHNWSGNRVTLRDWFQLCLKEGFTVFRDQEFSADMRSRAVQRIKDVRRLWSRQFPEDAGPLAHPPRPDHYVTIDNFYTATVYEKGAEVVRMLKALLGPEGFRAASDLYFDRHDGDAATIEDFKQAMEDASGRDLGQFKTWWTESGTPRVTIETTPRNDNVHLSLRQDLSPPRHIPAAYSIFDAKTGSALGAGRLEMTEAETAIDLPLHKVDGDSRGTPLVSVFSGYGAPVHIDRDLPLAERLSHAAFDPDPFNRWASVEALWRDLSLNAAGAKPFEDADAGLDGLAKALNGALDSDTLEPAFIAELLKCPTAPELLLGLENINPTKIVSGRNHIRQQIAQRIAAPLQIAYRRHGVDAPFDPGAAQAGHRALKNAALSLLVTGGQDHLAMEQAANASNMTDAAAALGTLAQSDSPDRQSALEAFYQKWKDNPLVVNKWLSWRAMRSDAKALSDLEALLQHDAFDFKTPNKVRALIGVFANANLAVFHAEDGAGYVFFLEQVLKIDPLNPQLAAGLTNALDMWQRLEPGRREKAKNALDKMANQSGISSNLKEMLDRLCAEKDIG